MKKTPGKTNKERGTEDELKRQNKFLLALQESTFDLVSETQMDKLLVKIVKRACKLFGVSSGYLDLLQPGDDHLTPTIALGVLKEGSLNLSLRRGEGVTGKVWETGEPVVIDDYDAWPDRVPSYKMGIFRAIMAVPLML
jgi:transcriptional regulator with GAF, ATPase, and Fis domain